MFHPVVDGGQERLSVFVNNSDSLNSKPQIGQLGGVVPKNLGFHHEVKVTITVVNRFLRMERRGC